MSSLQTMQVKVTLPEELFFYVKSRADRLGLNLASYLRHLAINDVEKIDIPNFVMNDKNEKVALKAIDDFKKGKTKEIKNLDKYLSDL